MSLRTAAISTFESLAFLFAEGEPAAPGAAGDAAVCVPFAGPVRGRLVVCLTTALLPVLAGNMLGDEQGASAAMATDALGEIANVICGNLLPAVGGPEAVFDLGAPRPVRPDALAPAPVHARIALDGGHAEVRLYLEEDGGRA